MREGGSEGGERERDRESVSVCVCGCGSESKMFQEVPMAISKQTKEGCIYLHAC